MNCFGLYVVSLLIQLGVCITFDLTFQVAYINSPVGGSEVDLLLIKLSKILLDK
jgi:hypothetical protein